MPVLLFTVKKREVDVAPNAIGIRILLAGHRRFVTQNKRPVPSLSFRDEIITNNIIFVVQILLPSVPSLSPGRSAAIFRFTETIVLVEHPSVSKLTYPTVIPIINIDIVKYKRIISRRTISRTH